MVPYAVEVPYWNDTVPANTSGFETGAVSVAPANPTLDALAPPITGGATWSSAAA